MVLSPDCATVVVAVKLLVILRQGLKIRQPYLVTVVNFLDFEMKQSVIQMYWSYFSTYPVLSHISYTVDTMSLNQRLINRLEVYK
jgi:hypothetical protein